MSQPSGYTKRKIPQIINRLRKLYENNPNNLVPSELKQLLNTDITQIMRNNIEKRLGLASNSPGNSKNPNLIKTKTKTLNNSLLVPSTATPNRQPGVNNREPGANNREPGVKRKSIMEPGANPIIEPGTLSSPNIGLNYTQNELNAIRTRENKRNPQMGYNNVYWNIHGTNYGTIVKGKSKRRTNREFVQKYRTSKNKTKYSKNEVNNVNNANARVTSYNAYIARQINKKEFKNTFTKVIEKLRGTADYIKNEYKNTELSESIIPKIDALHAKFNSSLNNVKQLRTNTQYVNICNEIEDVIQFINKNLNPEWRLATTNLTAARIILLKELNCKQILNEKSLPNIVGDELNKWR